MSIGAQAGPDGSTRTNGNVLSKTALHNECTMESEGFYLPLHLKIAA